MENGPSFLVARSQGFPPQSMESLDELEVRFHFRMASLLCSLTRGQRDDLAAVCNMCVIIAQNQLKDSNNRSLTRLPCSYQLMRSLYIKGKGAMLPNLPRPSVQIDWGACLYFFVRIFFDQFMSMALLCMVLNPLFACMLRNGEMALSHPYLVLKLT
jgi:hypothetical protein